MSDASQIVRQWAILRVIGARRFGTSVQELASEMQVSSKTIRRDLQTLSTVGFPIEEQVVDYGRKLWKVRDDTHLPALQFTLTEVMSLYVGRRLLEPLAGTLFWEGARSSFRKIKAVLGDSALAYLDKLAGIIHSTSSGASDYSERSQMIDDLLLAIEDRKVTFVVYQSLRATEPVSTEVYPYGLVYHVGSLYLVAHAVEAGAIRHYKIDRVESVDVQHLRFVKPATFDLTQWMSASFGIFRSADRLQRIVVRFSGEFARYVSESKWHASQSLSRQPDGSLFAEFQLPDTNEIKRWILSFGPAARVLEPQSLIAEIREELEQMAQAYASADDTVRE